MPALVVRARQVETFEEFCARPGPAIALDGYVVGPTRWDLHAEHANINHHEGVDRFGTRATCEQVALAVRSGLLQAWRGLLDEGPTVWVNDADPDICLSVWLLRNPARVTEPRVDALVRMEGLIDTTGGTCVPCDEAVTLEELNWVMEPWLIAREAGLYEADDAFLAQVIEEVCDRLDQYADGAGGRCDDCSSYDVLFKTGRVSVVVEHGPLARAHMLDDGVEAFVSVRARSDGRSIVTLAKTSPFVTVDIDAAYALLNDLEGCGDSTDRWGGSDTIGGSPRASGTGLEPALIAGVLAGC